MDSARLNRVPALDGLRAIAILGVLGYHLVPHRMPGGYLGVDLFFVLSGFLITSLLMKETDLKRFYLRRALRILPPLVVAVALAALFADPKAPVEPRHVAASLLFYANLMPFSDMPLMGHLWSLAVEEHFYALWPLLFMFAPRWRNTALITAVIGGLAVRVALLVFADDEAAYKCTAARVDALAMGCLLALHKPPQVPLWAAAAAFGAIGAMFLFAKWTHPVMPSVGLTAIALLAVVVLRSMRHPLIASALSPIAWIGRRSYGLYLYHPPVIAALMIWPPSPWLTLAKLLAVFAVAELSFITIERWSERVRSAIRSDDASNQDQPQALQKP
jgi:peptidoglycan/LPS O-acetylase OafA/YrhL